MNCLVILDAQLVLHTTLNLILWFSYGDWSTQVSLLMNHVWFHCKLLPTITAFIVLPYMVNVTS